MTSSDYSKEFKQLINKPVKLNKFLKHNKPKERKFGKVTKKCSMCGNPKGHIDKYKIGLCRRCFRLNAHGLGFKKFI